jgi:hypothetical protein
MKNGEVMTKTTDGKPRIDSRNNRLISNKAQ